MSTEAKIATAAVLLALLLGVTVPVLLDRTGPETVPPEPSRVERSAAGGGVHEPDSGEPTPGAKPAAVAGVVYDVATMEPIAGARAGTATTGADGSYRLTLPGKGPWRVTAEADGYRPGTILLFEPGRAADLEARRGDPDHDRPEDEDGGHRHGPTQAGQLQGDP